MTVSFPHLGNYYHPIEKLLKFIFPQAVVMPPPPITQKTLEIGSKYSPDFVCVPFKYNLGNFIEALENGADVIMQAGGGCRFGYYSELQEQILNDLGYKYKFVNLIGNEMSVRSIYKSCKELGSTISFIKFLYFMLLTVKTINVMDKLDFFIRENIGFAVNANEFENLQNEFFKELKTVKNFSMLIKFNHKYTLLFKKIELNKDESHLRVGIIGELYTNMEPFSNYFMEKELAKYRISVARFTNASYLLFQKPKVKIREVKESEGYIKYALGADGTHSVTRSIQLSKSKFDGIIHLKPFGCMPEINAIPVLQNIAKDFRIPIIYFSFDSQTSETGIKTRLEAFYDMIMMKKETAKDSMLSLSQS